MLEPALDGNGIHDLFCNLRYPVHDRTQEIPGIVHGL